MLMAMFVISMIPAVVAEDADTTVVEYDDQDDPNARALRARENVKERLDARRDATKERIQARRANVKERVDTKRENIKKRVEDRKERLADGRERRKDRAQELRKKAAFKEYKERAGKARALAKERVQKARERAKHARERAKEARQKFHEARDRVRERREEVAKCKGDDSDECNDLRAEAKADAIEALAKAAETAIEELQNMRSRVEESEDLSEERAAALLEGIDKHLAKLERVQDEIEGLDEDSTRDEIRNAAKHLREALKDVKQGAKRLAGKVVNARIGGVLVRSRQLQDHLNNVLERAENAGRDTSAVDSLVDEFDAHLNLAEQEYELAREAYDAGQDGAREHLQASHDALKEAHKTLKEIFRTLKNSNMHEELEEVADSDVVEEDDDDESDDESDEDDEDEE